MASPLAVFNYQLGSYSETFVKRHMDRLVPGGTVIITSIEKDKYGGHWTVNAPTLVLERVQQPRLRAQIIRAAHRKLWWGEPESLELAAIKKFLGQNKVEVLLGEYLDKSVYLIPVARQLGIRCFGHAHGYDISRVLRNAAWRKRYLRYNQADGIITMSNVSRDRLIELGIVPNKIHVVPYGVDVPGCYPVKKRNDLVRCLVVSRMTGKKGPILVLDAFRRALKIFPHLRLDWIGEGDLMAAAIQFVDAFRMREHVTFHGGQPQEFTAILMQESDIFIQHSVTDPVTGDEEGLPVAILEAMANGLPVLSTRHAGIPEAVVEGVTGFLVEEGDTAGMAKYLVQLAEDRLLRERMGEAGWQRVKSEFAWDLERSRLLSILGLERSTVAA